MMKGFKGAIKRNLEKGKSREMVLTIYSRIGFILTDSHTGIKSQSIANRTHRKLQRINLGSAAVKRKRKNHNIVQTLQCLMGFQFSNRIRK